MPDFGFVGPSYEAPSIYQESQECPCWQAGQGQQRGLHRGAGVAQVGADADVGPHSGRGRQGAG